MYMDTSYRAFSPEGRREPVEFAKAVLYVDTGAAQTLYGTLVVTSLTQRVRLWPAASQSAEGRRVASTAPQRGTAVTATMAKAHASRAGLSGMSSANAEATSTETSTGRTMPSGAYADDRAPT